MKIEELTVNNIDNIKTIFIKKFFTNKVEIEAIELDEDDTLCLRKDMIVRITDFRGYNYVHYYAFNMYGITWSFNRKELEK